MVCLALNFFIKPCPYGGALFYLASIAVQRPAHPPGPSRRGGTGPGHRPEHVLQPGVAGLLLELSLIPSPDGRGIRPGQNQVPTPDFPPAPPPGTGRRERQIHLQTAKTRRAEQGPPASRGVPAKTPLPPGHRCPCPSRSPQRSAPPPPRPGAAGRRHNLMALTSLADGLGNLGGVARLAGVYNGNFHHVLL